MVAVVAVTSLARGYSCHGGQTTLDVDDDDDESLNAKRDATARSTSVALLHVRVRRVAPFRRPKLPGRGKSYRPRRRPKISPKVARRANLSLEIGVAAAGHFYYRTCQHSQEVSRVAHMLTSDDCLRPLSISKLRQPHVYDAHDVETKQSLLSECARRVD